jgi:hypothetical protein
VEDANVTPTVQLILQSSGDHLTLTNQNYFPEEIKSRLKLGNACYYSVQNLLSSNLLSKNLKIKIFCPLSCIGVKFGR